MFYEPGKTSHGLPHDPLKACLVPRPIGWISTLSADGVANLAPYSFFNGVGGVPPVVMFSSVGRGPEGMKDTRANCEATGEFVVNVATYDLREAVNQSSVVAPSSLDEFELTGLTKAASSIVKPPRVEESPIHLECRYLQTVELPGDNEAMVLGQVVGVHIHPSVLTDGRVDIAKLRPIARLGYMEYAVVTETFEMQRPSRIESEATGG